jgi:hypothetical protein
VSNHALLLQLQPNHTRGADLLQFLRPDVQPEIVFSNAFQSARRTILQPVRLPGILHSAAGNPCAIASRVLVPEALTEALPASHVSNSDCFHSAPACYRSLRSMSSYCSRADWGTLLVHLEKPAANGPTRFCNSLQMAVQEQPQPGSLGTTDSISPRMRTALKRRTELGHSPKWKRLKSRGKNSNRLGQSEP